MQHTDKYIYENVIPTNKKNSSTNVQFKDSNDIFEYERKKIIINFSRFVNKIILFIILLFLIIIFFKLYRVFFVIPENHDSYVKLQENSRGKIFDRNGELIATNIDTKDLYLDTRKILNQQPCLQSTRLQQCI